MKMALTLQFFVIVLLSFLVLGTRLIQAQNVTTPRPSLPSECSNSCLLVSVANSIITYNPETSRTTTLISGLLRAVGLDVDAVKGFIYWSDISERVIKRANVDGSNVVVLFRNGIGVCDGLAIDQRAGRLYWTDTTHDTIEVADVYSSQKQRRVLFNVSLDQPRGIALELDKGYLFWTDWGRTAKIERSTLSGGSRTAIVSGGLVWPNGVAVDYNSKMLVWADAKLDKIETSDYNGNNRRVLYQQAGIHPYGVVVKGPLVYWTDWRKGLQRLDLSSNGTVTGHRLPGGTPFGILLLTSPTKNASRKYVCSFDNGTCGMTNNTSGNFTWARISGGTPSDRTGPSRDHTTGSGSYMYTEASSKSPGARALLLSPVFYTKVSAGVSGCVQFWFHMWGVNMGTLRIKVDGKSLWQRSGNQGNRWIPAAVPFRAFFSYQVEFEGIIGSNFRSDIAIDDVVITTGTRNCNLPGTPAPPTTRPLPTTAPTDQVSRVRLVNGRNSAEGRIEVFVRGRWGTVCDDGFDIRDAQVFCRMLGMSPARRIAAFGRGSGQIWLDDLNCRGDEASVNQCSHRGIGSHNCGHDEDVGIVCTINANATKPPQVSRVRLVNGNNPREGRVEVFVRGRWGTVCDDRFDIREAHVVCRMLGFPGARSAQCCARYGQGSGQIWLDDLRCQGNESSIFQCPHRGIGSHNCGHSEDAGVICQPRNKGIRRYNCTFDQGMCGMVNSRADQFDWTRHRGPTSSIGTGPFGDHTTGSGYYMYTEASQPNTNDTARLLSPVLNTNSSSKISGCVQFWFHMWGSSMGTLRVHVNGQVIWQRSGNQGNRWIPAATPFLANASYQVEFEGVRGSSFESDIAIDDVVITTGTRNCGIPTPAPPTTRPTRRTTPPPQVSRVRLVNGRNSAEGRIEVFVRGRWGTVCDDSFDIRDAHVFCRMLGLFPAQRIAKFGPGSGQIWLDNLNCRGNETSINQCPHSGIGNHDCVHGEDTGVVCTTRVKTTTPPPTTRPTTAPTPPPGVSPMATHCNFDHSNCGLYNVKGDDFNWRLRSGPTPSIATGPSHDVTGHGRYYYIEATGRRKGQRARLQSNPFRLYYKACLTFFYHMYGSDMGTLKILLNDQVVWQLDGNQGDQWHIANIPILHPGLKKLTIEGILGKSFRSDIAIDEISIVGHESMGPTTCVFAPSCAKPQASPTPTGPVPGSCGYSPRAPNSAFEKFRRIIGHVIGGNNARPGAWPWQIGLYRHGGFVCGGSLIKANWVLTAAHCMRNRNPSSYRIVLGDHDRNRNEGTEQSFNATRIIVHPNYDRFKLNNDVALIQLSRPATLNSRVGVVCLPRQSVQVAIGHQCYITGWGKIRHPGDSHHILQQALLPVVSTALCQRKLKASPGGHRLNITQQMVCGGEEGSIKSGCHGDSGGPYVCRRRDGSWFLEGAVSWGSPRCNTQERFTVFARISQFRRWIDGHIGVSS